VPPLSSSPAHPTTIMQLKVVEVVTGVDVTDTSAIKAMAQTFANQKQAPFDVVINNAGYFYGER